MLKSAVSSRGVETKPGSPRGEREESLTIVPRVRDCGSIFSVEGRAKSFESILTSSIKCKHLYFREPSIDFFSYRMKLLCPRRRTVILFAYRRCIGPDIQAV